MGSGSAPLVVVESEAARRAAVSEAVGAGWRVVEVGPPPGAVWSVAVADRAGAAGAVLAAARGCGLIVLAARALAADLSEDLRRLGRVHYRDEAGPVLDAAGWAMLHAVAGGLTVEAAARTLHLSVRTAQRRLAGAQRELGVASLAAAVARLGSPERIPPAGLATSRFALPGSPT